MLAFFLLALVPHTAEDPRWKIDAIVKLWDGRTAPHDFAKNDSLGQTSTLEVFLPSKALATGAAVIVCPGGGYGHLAMVHEGYEVADWLRGHGIAAFILRYPIVKTNQPGPIHPAPLLDAQRALRLVRARGKEWGVDPQKVGIWGFSAGGHLASSAATHFDAGDASATDAIDRVSCRPDFAILSYPVISMKPPYTHTGSRNNLLGKDADPQLIESFSNDQAVTKETPPTFLFHTDEDTPVPPMNSILFYTALKKHGVPAELHIYEKGKHGVGLLTPNPRVRHDPALQRWPHLLRDWLARRGLVKE